MIKRALFIVAMVLSAGLCALAHARGEKELELSLLGRYQSGIFGPDRAAAESLAHDPGTANYQPIHFNSRSTSRRTENPRFQTGGVRGGAPGSESGRNRRSGFAHNCRQTALTIF